MKSNSNLTITDYKVDPTSQQISEIYINGEKLETGSEPILQNKVVNISSMQQFDIFSTGYYEKEIKPSENYDGLSKATFRVISTLFAPDSIKMVTLKKISSSTTINGIITYSNISDSSSFHDIGTVTFYGKFYTISETGILSDTSYTFETGPCGSSVVRIGSSYYDKIKLSWD